jgi:hypothetical protein
VPLAFPVAPALVQHAAHSFAVEHLAVAASFLQLVMPMTSIEPSTAATRTFRMITSELRVWRTLPFLVLLGVSAAAVPARAEDRPLPFRQESAGAYNAHGVRAQGAFIGTPVNVDRAFTTRHEHDPPDAPFRVIVPKDPDVGIPELIRFATATPDKRAIEILRFTGLNMPLRPRPADRLAGLATFLRTTMLPQLSKDYTNVRVVEVYATKVGQHDAVALHGQMTKPGSGEVYAVKVMGIVPAQKPAGLLAFVMADTRLSEVRSPGDLASKGVGLRIIHSLEFTGQ